ALAAEQWVGERIGEPIRRLIAVVAVRRPAPDAAFGLIRATARYYSRASAFPTLLPVGRPSSAASQRPVSASASRSTPVSSPMPRGLRSPGKRSAPGVPLSLRNNG